MKTLLANVSNSFFVRNFLRSEALKIIEKEGDIQLIFLVASTKIDYYRNEFKDHNITFDIMPEVEGFRIERIFKFLETASIHTRTSYMLSRTNLHRDGSKTFAPLRYAGFFFRYIFWSLGKYHFWRSILRRVYYIIPNHSFDTVLAKYNPDLVYLPSMIYKEDYILAKAARKRGIKTLGMTLSWDNFYSKTFLLVMPDLLMVQTDLIVKQARELADYDGDIIVTGIPQYDTYFHKKNITTREEFFKKIGADPKKKLILYAFSGKAGLNIEFSILDILHKAIESKEIKENVQVLLRPYPRYDFSKNKLHELEEKYGFIAVQPVAHPSGSKGDWEFDESSLNFLANSLAHANLVITLYSTFFIEAAIFDKPLVSSSFDGATKLDYWNSAKRFFDWDHLREIKQCGGISIADNYGQFILHINKYLENKSIDSTGRRNIVLQQCQFTDGKSGERVAKTILQTI